MKKIYRDKILNIPGTDIFDQTFLFDVLIPDYKNSQVEVIFLRDELKKYKNEEILKKVGEKPAIYSEVYSPKDELMIFTELFEHALKQNKKIHIVGVTLGEEIKILENYYESLGFLREDINAFDVDFSLPLVTVSCHIQNLMWKGSDYKRERENIFFCPPVRESGQNKALFKGITRGVIAGIDMSCKNVGVSFSDTQNISGQALELPSQYQNFLQECIVTEKILPLNLGKVLKYNLEDVGIGGEVRKMKIIY